MELSPPAPAGADDVPAVPPAPTVKVYVIPVKKLILL